MANWNAWNNIDVEQLNSQVEELGNSGDFEELPDGKYEVRLDSLELKPTKEKGYPMVAATFTIVEGKHSKWKMFVNQVLLMGNDADKYRVNTCNKFLSSLRTDGEKIRFLSVANYETQVNETADKCIKMEYLIEKSTNNKGFTNYKILEIYGTDDPF